MDMLTHMPNVTERTDPVQALGYLARHDGFRPLPPPPAPGPVIITPALYNQAPQLTFPAEFRNLPTVNGYQEAHQRYVELKNRFSAQAFAVGPVAEVIVIKFWVKVLLPGRKTAVWVAVSEAMTFPQEPIQRGVHRIFARPLDPYLFIAA